MTGGEVFLDTNVLVDSYDRTDLAKQRQAVETLDALAVAGRGTVSTHRFGSWIGSDYRPARRL